MRSKMYPALIALIMLAAGCVTSPETTTPEDTTPANAARIGNARTKVFHETSCRYVEEIQEKVSFESREAALAAGYREDESDACNP